MVGFSGRDGFIAIRPSIRRVVMLDHARFGRMYRDSLPKSFVRGSHAGSPPYLRSDTKRLHEPAFQTCVMHPRHRAPMTHLGACGEIGMPSGRLPRKSGACCSEMVKNEPFTPLASAVAANSTRSALPGESPLASPAIINLVRRVEMSALVSVRIFEGSMISNRV